MTLGSLFDGIGVFPLAARENGIEPLWASEIEKGPMSITRRQFPGMAHLGDITKVSGAAAPPVNVITFGSPCQDMSLAGLRDGLGGARSGLFHHATRIIREMREATNGIFPVIAVWENVLGAFSSNDRMDFRAVLESVEDACVPMPPSGRWAACGMARGQRPDIAWRVMDAQYWGIPPLPQRRKRIFLVADFGGTRATEILFKPRCMLADTDVCGAGGRTATERDRISPDETGREIPVVHPIQGRRLRGAAAGRNYEQFTRSFGQPTDPFPTLTAGHLTAFAFWIGDDYKNGLIRHLTPLECERLQGLPDGWTALGADGEAITDTVRYKAIGNAVALPCASYIMRGIADVLTA